MVTKIMKGIYNARPPIPKYSTTWDVATVVNYLKDLGSNRDLPLKQLTGKLAILMALIQACRTSELAALDLKYRVYKPEGVLFKLPTVTKKRAVGAPPKELFFGGFPDDGNLCVINCLRAYENATQHYRQGQTPVTKLFLSYVKPHGPVTSQRIAKWIKSILGEAGINITEFSAHSTRGAAATAAIKQGVTTAEVLNMADWSTDSTFKRH